MKEYYLGLDMGTNSVGWAVTDDQYRILRAKGKDLWGIREFEEAKTAEARRMNRTSRRRRQREVVRRGLLREYFADEIEKVDPSFYCRLDNSKYYPEDKDDHVKGKNGLFSDPDFSDRDYYNKYLTIYHLRMELINNPAPHDVRLVYLAIYNLFKHRGHFLGSISSDEAQSNTMQDSLHGLIVMLSENYDINLAEVDAKAVENILKSRSYSKTEKAEELGKIFFVEKKKDKAQYEILKAIAGCTIDLKNIFGTNEEGYKLSFSDVGYEEKIPDIAEAVGDEGYQVISEMKEVYDLGILAEIMHGNNYLSESRIQDYEKHHKDLKILKGVIRKYCTEEAYNKMFRSEEGGSYSAYVKSYNSGTKLRRNMKNRTRDEFYAYVKSTLKAAPKEDVEVQKILEEIERQSFMPKMLTSANGTIPNQIHLRELKAILKNAERYLPFLNQKDSSGYTTSERIIMLFQFRIPYFVGPVVNRDGKGNGWAVRKEEGEVLPWNLDQKIDLRKTKEEFINRLIRECTYISGAKVLPKGSLLYEKYAVLNEINNIRINDEKITVELKQEIFNDLFCRYNKVTRKKLTSYLLNRGIITNDFEVTGIDEQINNALTSYVKFYAILGDKMKEDKVKESVEEIIKVCTIYKDDKKERIQTLKDNYSKLLDDNEIKKISSIRFGDWGKLSKDFLEMSGCDKETGEQISLIKAMWETNYNLMELIHSEKYTFAEDLEEQRHSFEKAITQIVPDDLDEFYFSAPVKRMVWQTILIIRELTKVMGNAPKRIFIEMARSDEEKGDKGRTNSRKKQLLDLYKTIKDDTHNWVELINEEDSTGRLKSKKMFLYITQMGRDMYTGKPIDLDRLFDDNLYDIDHIYPRQFVKDNNLLNNMVLVNKPDNSAKTNDYPLPQNIASNLEVQELWRTLRAHNLITEEKYRRLTSRIPFTDEDKAGFIARQLVETGQATKGVADLLKEILPESRIVYSKASNVSDFRHKYDIPKCRLVNDFHHAHDAYLNIVVGNVYLTKFTDNPLKFIKEEYKRDSKKNNYHLGKIFEYNVERNGYTAWIGSKDEKSGTIVNVKKTLSRQTPLLTRMTYESHGAISDGNPLGKYKAKEGIYLPLKQSDEKLSVEKYGGLNKPSGAYFFVVEHEEKKKLVKTIETVPLYLAGTINTDDDLLRYCTDTLGLVKPRICVSKIKMQALVKFNGYYLNITGRSGSRLTVRNAVSMKMTKEEIKYINNIVKSVEEGKLRDGIKREKNLELYDKLLQKHIKSILKNRPNPVGNMLFELKAEFEKRSELEQCIVLIQIINLSIIGKAQGDLKLIGGSPNTGVMLISKKITGNTEYKLINQSVTGLFETEVDLLKA